MSAFAEAQFSQCTFRIENNDTRIGLLEDSHAIVKFDLDKGEETDRVIKLKRVIMFEKNRKKNKTELEKTNDVIVMFDTKQTKQLVSKVSSEYDEDLIGKVLDLKSHLTINATRSKSNDRKVIIKLRTSASSGTMTMRLSGIGAVYHGSLRVPFSYTGTKGILWAKKAAQKNKLQKIKFSCRVTDAPSNGSDEVESNNDSDDVRAEKQLLKEMNTVISE